MKKITALLALGGLLTASLGASAQQAPVVKWSGPLPNTAHQTLLRPSLMRGDESRSGAGESSAIVRNEAKGHQLFSLTGGDSVGTTGYDFQTNATMMERIINWGEDGPEGILSSLIWMASTTLHPNTNDRGTYGAVLTDIGDAATWLPINLNKWERIENVRSGFCDLDYFKNGDFQGQIAFVSHANDQSGVTLAIETSKGSGDFGFQVKIPNSVGGLWPRIAIDGGGVIHVIWTYQETDPFTNEPDQNAGVLRYIRTTDQGTTWQQPVDFASASTQTLREVIGGDAYQIAANGDNVAIWYYTRSVQILQIYSANNGANWTASLVDQPQYQHAIYDPLGENPDSALFSDPSFGVDTLGFRSDTVPAPGSSFDLMVTPDGTVIGAYPVWASYLTRFFPAGSDTSAATFRGGIIYRQPEFAYTDYALRFARTNIDGVLDRSTVPAPAKADNSGEFYQDRGLTSGLARWPQFGMNSEGRIFLIFGAGNNEDVVTAAPEDSTTERTFFRNHTYITNSRDGGLTWETPRDLTPVGVDAQFATLADNVDDEVHIALQADTYPGDYLTSSDTGSGYGLHPAVFSNIEAMILPVGTVTSVADRADGNGLVSMASPQPNPTAGTTRLSYTIGRTGHAKIEVFNVLGQKVATLLDGNRVAGTYVTTFDASALGNGVHYITLSSNDTKTAVKLTVNK